MPARTVVTRTRKIEKTAPADLARSDAQPKGWAFRRDMIQALSPNWQGAAFLREYRSRAWDAYERLLMPATTDEAWRRTDIRELASLSFQLPSLDGRGLVKANVGKDELPPDTLLAPIADIQHGGQIVLTPRQAQVVLSPELATKGVIFTDLATAEQQHPEVLAAIMGQIVSPEEGKFAALASALAQTGVLVYVPRGVRIEQPLHSVLWGPGIGLAYFSHILVWVDDGASLTYVHESASPGGSLPSDNLHVGIVEIRLGEGANLHFVELQSWGESVWNFSHERAHVGRDSSFDWIFGAIGSRLTKNFSSLDLVGEGATGRMSGFYFTNGTQHLDHDTQQNHLAPHTTSDLLFKGALKGQSRSVWQGMIYVAPDAQKTDGYQANRNLVLSRKAHADSIPGLEICANDVRCTHGATVGKVDPDQIFYLRSRGIPYEDAERLIVEGFFDPIMQRIPFEGVRSRFQQAIQDKMSL
jgi:Fe-S cluster assembly protein SufD